MQQGTLEAFRKLLDLALPEGGRTAGARDHRDLRREGG